MVRTQWNNLLLDLGCQKPCKKLSDLKNKPGTSKTKTTEQSTIKNVYFPGTSKIEAGP